MSRRGVQGASILGLQLLFKWLPQSRLTLRFALLVALAVLAGLAVLGSASSGRLRGLSTAFAPAQPCTMPVVGVPITPGMLDYSARFVASIDSATDTLVLVVNGFDEATSAWVEDLQPGAFVRRIIKVFAPENLGVAGATNRILFETPEAPFWFISNNDIKLAPGALAEMCRAAKAADASVGSMHPVMLSGIFPHRDHGWSAFVLLKPVVEALGIWDENLWPAYAEDGDYETRLYGAGLRMQRLPYANVFHGPLAAKDYTSGTERARNENRHPFFSRALAQVKAADREAYTAIKFSAWAANYNADAILHFRQNPAMFRCCKPMYGAASTRFHGFWVFDAARRACILGASVGSIKDPGNGEGLGSYPDSSQRAEQFQSTCSFDTRVIAQIESGSLSPAAEALRVQLLTSWNGADNCQRFSECLARFRLQPHVLRVVVLTRDELLALG